MVTCKDGFFTISCIDSYSSISQTGIYGGKDANFSQCIDELVHSEKWARVTDCHGFWFAIVDTKPKGSILFRREYNYAFRFRFQFITSSWSILLISVAANCLSVFSFLYGAVCNRRTFLSVCSTRFFAVVIRPRFPSRLSANLSERLSNSEVCSWYLLGIVILSHQSLLRLSSSALWIFSCFFICWGQSKVCL